MESRSHVWVSQSLDGNMEGRGRAKEFETDDHSTKENHAEDRRRRRSRRNRLSKTKGGLIQKNAFRVGDLYTKEDNRVTNEGEGGEEVQSNLGRTCPRRYIGIHMKDARRVMGMRNVLVQLEDQGDRTG
jgi:hypothetical protein